ncbi:hypothetical protein [Planctomycetes bacterium K23_9]|uniref:Uncharacterized protein n=1 Tax=Stieleria marina TaxID=1930275 RepID=A0A517NRK1_9BACT|nr:hypothetical protein K239x_16920 [Planctomycetes bacterium K23_9]
MPSDQTPTTLRPRTRRFFRWLALTGSLGIVVSIWCSVLPRIAATPRMRRQLVFLDERGIDPSAMFYTELDVMESILDRLENR